MKKDINEQFEINDAFRFVRDSLVRSKNYIETGEKAKGKKKEIELELFERLIECVDEWFGELDGWKKNVCKDNNW